jgi:hypothetical protein
MEEAERPLTMRGEARGRSEEEAREDCAILLPERFWSEAVRLFQPGRWGASWRRSASRCGTDARLEIGDLRFEI